MKAVFSLALVAIVALAPALSAQTDSFTGKWEGTVDFLRPDGTIADSDPILFNLTQKGKELTGTVGDGAEGPWKIEKGVVADGKANFEVQQPDGPLLKFTLANTKGKLEGEVQLLRDGVVRAKGKIEAAKSK